MLDMNNINVKITEKVTEYINKGFVINIDSMRCSQGVNERVDLTDGKKLVRIFVDHKGYNHDIKHNIIELIVGEHPFPKHSGIILNDNLSVIEKTVYCIMNNKRGNMFICTEEEAKVIDEKRAARRSYHKMTNTRDLGESYKKAILPLIRRRFRGMKTAKVSDITSCFVVTGNHRDLHEYCVICRDKLFTF